MPATEHQELRQEVKNFGFLEVTVLILSVYVLAALLAQSLLEISPAVLQLLDHIDLLVCAVFFVDFLVNLRRAKSKWRFMRWGWIDLVSCIPVYDAFRWGRLARLLKIIRILRAFRSARHIMAYLYRRRSRGLAVSTILTAVILILFSCIAILAFEDAPESNIKTPFDAVWWAISTMTTVGYGDRFPVTVEGKLVAIVLMIFGVGLFGVLTGLFAKIFVESDLQRESEHAILAAEVRLLRERLEANNGSGDSDNGRTDRESELNEHETGRK